MNQSLIKIKYKSVLATMFYVRKKRLFRHWRKQILKLLFNLEDIFRIFIWIYNEFNSSLSVN